MKERLPGGTRETGTFEAFRVICYSTFADRDAKENVRSVRYAMTEKEAADAAPTVDKVEVTLKDGYFKVTTSDGHCFITHPSGAIGLDQAIQEGIATIHGLPEPHNFIR